MRIREYISGLDYQQLLLAKDVIDERITEIRNESKTALWIVCDDDLNYAAFTEDKHMQAVERMAEEAKKYASTFPDVRVRFEVIKRFFRESEVAEMLSL